MKPTQLFIQPVFCPPPTRKSFVYSNTSINTDLNVSLAWQRRHTLLHSFEGTAAQLPGSSDWTLLIMWPQMVKPTRNLDSQHFVWVCELLVLHNYWYGLQCYTKTLVFIREKQLSHMIHTSAEHTVWWQWERPIEGNYQVHQIFAGAKWQRWTFLHKYFTSNSPGRPLFPPASTPMWSAKQPDVSQTEGNISQLSSQQDYSVQTPVKQTFSQSCSGSRNKSVGWVVAREVQFVWTSTIQLVPSEQTEGKDRCHF